MNEKQYKVFCNFKDDLKSSIKKWSNSVGNLQELQKEAVIADKTPLYSLETPVVYNKDLDLITKDSQIKLIVIGDNPGKDEQLLKNNRYLVGQAGKIADGFFKKNPELKIDFRKNVIILNKTPVHSAKTVQLKRIMQNKDAAELILESQIWMAEKTVNFLSDYNNAASSKDDMLELWLVGYSELKEKGIFIPYKNKMEECLKQNGFWKKVYVFQHFSMNRFSIDLNEFIIKNSSENCELMENIHKIGEKHRQEIFNFVDK